MLLPVSICSWIHGSTLSRSVKTPGDPLLLYFFFRFEVQLRAQPIPQEVTPTRVQEPCSRLHTREPPESPYKKTKSDWTPKYWEHTKKLIEGGLLTSPELPSVPLWSCSRGSRASWEEEVLWETGRRIRRNWGETPCVNLPCLAYWLPKMRCTFFKKCKHFLNDLSKVHLVIWNQLWVCLAKKDVLIETRGQKWQSW